MTLTRLEAVTLGLIVDRPDHAYALQARLAPGLPRSARPNDGVLRPLLSRLEKRGFVTSAARTHAGRERKVLSATAPGRAAFRAWLASGAHEADELGAGLFLEQPFVKLLFAGHLDADAIAAKLDGIAAAASARRDALRRIAEPGPGTPLGDVLLELGLAREDATLAAVARLRGTLAG